jgi:hypothetical protein
MRLNSKMLGGGTLLVLLALALVAGTAEARKKKDPLAPCRARCDRMAKEAQEKLQECTRSCPKPSPGNMQAFQACTQSCTKHNNTHAGGPSCVSKCDDGELDRKKPHNPHHAEHHEEKATHTRPPTSR